MSCLAFYSHTYINSSLAYYIFICLVIASCNLHAIAMTCLMVYNYIIIDMADEISLANKIKQKYSSKQNYICILLL
jgi:hypothetical protein